MLFLSDSEKIKQLQYSTAARMEWNRRVIKEEMDSGNHNPMVSVHDFLLFLLWFYFLSFYFLER